MTCAKPLEIEVGQRWVLRNGSTAAITCDRQEFAALPEWRWAMSNGRLVNDAGREDFWGQQDSPYDLRQLAAPLAGAQGGQ